MSIVENITDPIFVSEDKTQIDCMVKFNTVAVSIPFTARSNDCENHGREIYAAILAGQYGTIAAYTVPPELPKPKEIIQPASAGLQTI